LHDELTVVRPGHPSTNVAMTLSRFKIAARRPAVTLAACAAALAVSNCKRAERSVSASEDARRHEVVMRVGATEVRVDELEAQLRQLPPPALAMCNASPERKRDCINRLVDSELLAQEALRLGYDRRPDVIAATKRAMIRSMLSDRAEAVPPTDADIERHYREHQADFAHPEIARIIEIIVHSRSKAMAVWKTAQSTDVDEFRKLVAKYSESPGSVDAGGNLSLVMGDRDDPLRPLVDVAFALTNPGDTAPPVELPDGFHIVKLRERVPAGVKLLAEVKPRIARHLADDRRNKIQDEVLTASRAKAKVAVFDDKLLAVRWER
jgi:peptidyl-prolyl cis-trans isomerase C